LTRSSGMCGQLQPVAWGFGWALVRLARFCWIFREIRRNRYVKSNPKKLSPGSSKAGSVGRTWPVASVLAVPCASVRS